MLRIGPLVPGLRRYARALLHDPDAADDLVQDCLERGIRHWHRRRVDGSARTWMFTILHNLAVNRLRQNRRRGTHVPVEDAPDGALARPAGQEAGLHTSDIITAVDALPDDQRAVLLLVSVEDLTYAQAAQILDIPVGTVMSRLSRARERLRRLMAGDESRIATPHLRRVK